MKVVITTESVPVGEYMGMACPTCLKPIETTSGSSDSRFCSHDHSGWYEKYRDPLEVFEVRIDEWQGGFPESGVVGE